ncbi:MAG: hypothetical protein L0216_17760 [Planctomycetales bacterium]|nr:hypothetical protein [Planctomycetales bacterium]
MSDLLRAVPLAAAVLLGVAGSSVAQGWREEGSGGAFGRPTGMSLRLGLQGVFLVQGEVADGTNVPDYDDAFKQPGFGGLLEIAGRVSPEGSFHVGLGYVFFPGDKWQGLEFDDWSWLPFWVGGKGHLMRGGDLDPYVRLDVGLAWSSAVDIEVPPFGSGDHWQTSVLFFGDVGMGVSIQPRGTNASFFLEVLYRFSTGPEGDQNSNQDGDNIGILVLSAGVSFRIRPR